MGRHRFLAAVLAAVAILVTACGQPSLTGEPEPTPAPITEVTTLRFAYRGLNDTTMSAQVEAFQERFPQYRIERVPFEDDPRQLIDDQLVDVIVPVNVRFSNELLSSGLLLDMEPYLRNSDLDTGALGPLLEATRHEGKQVALPYRLLVDGLIFDQASMIRLGIIRPDAPLTWDTFRETLKALATEVDGVGFPGSGMAPRTKGLLRNI